MAQKSENPMLAAIEEFLSRKENLGKTLPNIRYFDGADCYCTPDGEFKGETLQESLMLFAATL